MNRCHRLLLPVLFIAALFAPSCRAQSPAGNYSPAVVTGTGQLGNIVSYQYVQAAPSSHTIDWSVSGTAPSACTFSVDGSSDKVNWYSLSGPQTCTSSNMFHITGKPVLYLRYYILTYTPGDGTTSLIFHYTRGQ